MIIIDNLAIMRYYKNKRSNMKGEQNAIFV